MWKMLAFPVDIKIYIFRHVYSFIYMIFIQDALTYEGNSVAG